MALKKDNHSVDNADEKFPKDEISSIDSKKLDKTVGIESQPFEESKGNNNENGFLDFGFNQSILNSLRNKGYKNPTPIQLSLIHI